VRPVSLGQRVLSSQQSLSCRAVSLALGVLLEGVRDGDGSVAQILPIHRLNGRIRGLETGVIDKCEPFAVSRLGVSLDLRSGQDDAKR